MLWLVFTRPGCGHEAEKPWGGPWGGCEGKGIRDREQPRHEFVLTMID